MNGESDACVIHHIMTPQASKSGPEDLSGAATAPAERTSNEDHTGGTPTKMEEQETNPSKSKTILVMVSVFLSMFLVGLDRTIISTVSRIKRQCAFTLPMTMC